MRGGTGSPAGSEHDVVLGLETSCDETSAAVLAGGDVQSLIIHSQDEHRVYGGVVPELAARAHLTRIDHVVEAALSDAGLAPEAVHAVAVTTGPGLIGALLVGVVWAKSFAYSRGIPVVGVHHMEAHLFAPLLEHPDLEPPFVTLLVSGGHTLLLHVEDWGRYVLLGETRDDAAGEAFDKVAKRLALPYPGGPHIERLASSSAPGRRLPRPLLRKRSQPGDDDFYDFSFSGLKTATALWADELDAAGTLEQERGPVAAAFQDAAIEVLVEKTRRAVRATGVDTVTLGGGVSVNRALRDRMRARLEGEARVLHASPRYSLDNGAMIALAGAHRLGVDGPDSLALEARADLPFPGLRRRGAAHAA